MKHAVIALLSTALSLQVNGAVQIVPAGEFEGMDGRPGKGLKWKLTDAQGHELAARLNARHVKTAFNFDYEHQLMLAEKNGQPAPASGWAQRFEWRDGEGLFALDVKWTERALQMLQAGEYRYLSPVIAFNKHTGQVYDVLNASLVGRPAVLDLDPVAQERIAQLNAHFISQEPSMNPVLKALLAALGLTDDVTEADASAAVVSLKAKAATADALTATNATLSAQVTQATTEIATLKAGGATSPDPTKWVSRESLNALNTEVTQLKARQVEDDVEQLLQGAQAEGKCAGVVVDVWRDVGKKDIAALKALIEKTPANPALAGQRQTTGKTPPEASAADDATVLAICSATGVTAEQFKAAA